MEEFKPACMKPNGSHPDNSSFWQSLVLSAGVQPRQDPGGTLRMNGIGERERERVTRRGCLQGLAESGNALFFTVAFIP